MTRPLRFGSAALFLIAGAAWADLNPDYQPDWTARRVTQMAPIQKKLKSVGRRARAFKRMAFQAERGGLPLAGEVVDSGHVWAFFGAPNGVISYAFPKLERSLQECLDDFILFLSRQAPEVSELAGNVLGRLPPEDFFAEIEGRGPLTAFMPFVEIETSRVPPGVKITLIRNAMGASLEALEDDVITHVGTVAVTDPKQFTLALEQYPLDTIVFLSLYRPSSTKSWKTQVSLQSRSDPSLNRAFLDHLQRTGELTALLAEVADLKAQLARIESPSDEEYAKTFPPVRLSLSHRPPADPARPAAGPTATPPPLLIVIASNDWPQAISSESRKQALADVEHAFEAAVGTRFQPPENKARALDGLQESYAWLSAMTDAAFLQQVAALKRPAPKH